MIDALFIVPGNAKGVYQALSEDYSAIETPTWALLLAQSVRAVGYKARIFDVNAERLSTSQAVQRIKKTNTRLLCFVVYGQNPNSGTVGMGGATDLAKAITPARAVAESTIGAEGSLANKDNILIILPKLFFFING